MDLEEIYYFRIDRPEGFAVQKVYTADRRIDETLTVRDGDLVLVPEGYHPVVAAHGYNVYYLNALAGAGVPWRPPTTRNTRGCAAHGAIETRDCRSFAEENRMDAVILGRIGYDLYSADPHVPLRQARRFAASLGGSSANMAVGLSRLGAQVGIVSCLGDDSISGFLLDFLNAEKVDTTFVQTRPGFLPSLALTEVSPPDRFPQVFYRHDAVDTLLAITNEASRLCGLRAHVRHERHLPLRLAVPRIHLSRPRAGASGRRAAWSST